MIHHRLLISICSFAEFFCALSVLLLCERINLGGCITVSAYYATNVVTMLALDSSLCVFSLYINTVRMHIRVKERKTHEYCMEIRRKSSIITIWWTTISCVKANTLTTALLYGHYKIITTRPGTLFKYCNWYYIRAKSLSNGFPAEKVKPFR